MKIQLDCPNHCLNLKEKKTKKENENDEEDHDDEDIWMTNIIERYEIRPNEPLFQNMCLAEFCSEFRVLAKSQVPKTQNENVLSCRIQKVLFKGEDAQSQL